MAPPKTARAAPRDADGDPRLVERLPDRLDLLDSAVTRNTQRPRRDLNAEARLQAAIVQWIRAVAPEVLVFAVPNGGLRSKAEAARMKWTGVVAGIPDLCIIGPGGRVYFIEVKASRGSVSRDQRAVHEWLTALGTPPAVCRSVDDARRAFAAWSLPTREARL